MATVKTLGSLLIESAQAWKHSFIPIGVGAVIFGALNGGVLLWTDQAPFLAMVFTMVISLISASYMLTVSIQKATSILQATKSAVQSILPVLGLKIWEIVRSFVFIPLLLGSPLLFRLKIR